MYHDMVKLWPVKNFALYKNNKTYTNKILGIKKLSRLLHTKILIFQYITKVPAAFIRKKLPIPFPTCKKALGNFRISEGHTMQCSSLTNYV